MAEHVAVVSLQVLAQQWRAQGIALDRVHATMGIGYKACADDLDACRGSLGSALDNLAVYFRHHSSCAALRCRECQWPRDAMTHDADVLGHEFVEGQACTCGFVEGLKELRTRL